MGDPKKQLMIKIDNRLHLKRRLYCFQLKEKNLNWGTHERLYKASCRFGQVDVLIEKEDKVLILLSSLPDEDYETFILTLINGKQSLSYHEVSSALVNHEFKTKSLLTVHQQKI